MLKYWNQSVFFFFIWNFILYLECLNLEKKNLSLFMSVSLKKNWVDINYVSWHRHELWMWLITEVHNSGPGVPPVRHILVFFLLLHTHVNSWQSIK